MRPSDELATRGGAVGEWKPASGRQEADLRPIRPDAQNHSRIGRTPARVRCESSRRANFGQLWWGTAG